MTVIIKGEVDCVFTSWLLRKPESTESRLNYIKNSLEITAVQTASATNVCSNGLMRTLLFHFKLCLEEKSNEKVTKKIKIRHLTLAFLLFDF